MFSRTLFIILFAVAVDDYCATVDGYKKMRPTRVVCFQKYHQYITEYCCINSINERIQTLRAHTHTVLSY